MGISFTVEPGRRYVVSTYEGTVSDETMLDAYRTFLESGSWNLEMGELVDLSRADMGEVTAQGLRKLSVYLDNELRAQGVARAKTAVHAPSDLPLGLARMYEAVAEEAPDGFTVFRDLPAATSNGSRRLWKGVEV